jgi:MFS family permease
MEPLPIFFTLFYLFGGVLFGFLWPQVSWRWGFWIAGPILVFLGLSVLFAGQFEVFIRKDLPLLLLAVASACFGSFISAWLKSRPKVSR